MSRIAKKPLIIKEGVEVTIQRNTISCTGHKGKLSFKLHPYVTVTRTNRTLQVQVQNEEDKKQRAIWGTTTRLITNMIEGVTEGFTKRLTLTGIGYRARMQGKKLQLEVGFSHPVDFRVPEDITVTVEGNNIIIVSGINKQKVGQIAANIRLIKKPEPYKGKGIAYENEVILRKAGKQAASSK